MDHKDKIIALSATGLDSPGLVSKITSSIFQLGGNIIDVEENCRRGLFSIFLIIDFSLSINTDDMIIDTLKSIEKKTGLKVILDRYDDPKIISSSKHESHLVTIIGMDKPGIIARISTFFYKHNINIENCKMIARGNFFSMEMIIDTNRMIVDSGTSRSNAINRMKNDLKALCSGINQSVVIQSENVYKRTKKLVVFDVESTLTQNSSMENFLGRIRGRAKSINGKLEFKENNKNQMQDLIENAKMLRGIPEDEFKKFSDILQLNPGSFELIRILKSMGFKIALISSGFNFFIKKFFEGAGVDYAFSNTLKTDKNGITTGELEHPIIASDTKDEILEFILNVENINRDQVIAVGDGSTCSHFIKNVGLSIAFKPDEKNINTDGILSSDQIINILYCLGIPQTELDKYTRSSDPK